MQQSTLNYTDKNHFKFGYDGQWFVPRQRRQQKWMCEYGVAENTLLTVKEANLQAALKIQADAKALGLDIFLLLSGGADSEVAARAFLDANVPFTAVLLKYNVYNTIANDHEICYADQFCKEYHIPTLELFLNPEVFFHTPEYHEITTISQTQSGQLACTMWAAKQIPGFAVLGQGEPFIYRQFGKWWFREKELICSWHKYWVFSGLKGTAGFHQYTPDQMLAYLTDPAVLNLIEQNLPADKEVANNANIKHALYQNHYSESDLANRTKYTGFEKLTFVDLGARYKLIERFPACLEEHTVEYNVMVNKLKGRI